MWKVTYYDRFTAYEEKFATEDEAFEAVRTSYQDDGVEVTSPDGEVVYSRKCWGQFW